MPKIAPHKEFSRRSLLRLSAATVPALFILDRRRRHPDSVATTELQPTAHVYFC